MPSGYKIINVVGARPNFIKIAPLMEAMRQEPCFEPLLVHTGQHYDKEMSHFFFQHLGIPKPDIDLGVGSSSHARQTAEIMRRFEPVLLEHKPRLVVVVGDVNSTIACALVATKLHIKVAHVEAGLRSFDRRMPEEINRLLTDAISDYLFTTEESARQNLEREGIPADKIYFVGNVMIDTLLKHCRQAEDSPILQRLGLADGRDYAVLTLHRPSNVDFEDTLKRILTALHQVARHIPVIFPVHPRTGKRIQQFGLEGLLSWLNPGSRSAPCPSGICCLKPLGYLDFLRLMSRAKLVLTDSGGMQEETTVLGIPCLTIRENTERPVTVSCGTNIVVGTSEQKIVEESMKVLAGQGKKGRVPEKWDGLAAKRIVDILKQATA
jgi:UDP-N-acetylglucosamine 2-epimerase (non-hydrolysing)